MMSNEFKKKSKNKMSIKIPKRKVFRTTEPLIAIFMWGVNYTVSFNKNTFFNKILT